MGAGEVVATGERDEKSVLSSLTVQRLKMMALEEKVTVPGGRKTKQTYVDAIWSARHSSVT